MERKNPPLSSAAAAAAAAPQTPRKRPRAAVVTPGSSGGRKKQRQLVRGWCEERSLTNFCHCFKARMPQNCQSCNERVEKGHCLHNLGYGWVHVRCDNDEKRTRRSLMNEFIPQQKLLTGGEQKTLLKQNGEEYDQSNSEDSTDLWETDDSEAEEEAVLTAEQRAILEYDARPRDTIRINALAGAGKTTTMAWLCHKLSDRLGRNSRILYVVFGSQASSEASASCRFPKNAEIRTSHSLAKRRLIGTGVPFKPANSIPRKNVVDVLDLKRAVERRFRNTGRKEVDRISKAIGSLVVRTITHFQYSSDETIRSVHVPANASYQPGTSARSAWKEKFQKGVYVAWATKYFQKILSYCQDPEDNVLAHDSYLKVFQLVLAYGQRSTRNRTKPFDPYLSKFDIDQSQLQYDAVLVDEAQDLTPCQADMLWGRRGMALNARIYLVGDEHQRIYRFRGALDSFEKTDVVRNFPLEGSFRFGPTIAKEANVVLSCCSSSRLKGLAAEEGVVSVQDSIERGVVICRTRNGMYRYLDLHQPKRWAFYTKHERLIIPDHKLLTLESFVVSQMPRSEDQEDIGFGFLRDEDDHVDQPATYKYRGTVFDTLQDLIEFCEDENDSTMLKNIFLIYDFHKRKRGTSISELADKIKKSWVKDWRADVKDRVGEIDVDRFDGVIFVTAHNAKGQQFDRVLVHNDFNFAKLLSNLQGGTFADSLYVREHAHFIYVAMTRAKKELFLSTDAAEFIQELRNSKLAAVNKTSCVDLSACRAEMEQAWKDFVADPTSSISSLDDIPWPVGEEDNFFCLDCIMSVHERKTVLKASLLRYHPDKFLSRHGRRIVSGELRKVVQERLEVCTHRATELWRNLPTPGEE